MGTQCGFSYRGSREMSLKMATKQLSQIRDRFALQRVSDYESFGCNLLSRTVIPKCCDQASLIVRHDSITFLIASNTFINPLCSLWGGGSETKFLCVALPDLESIL